MRPPGIRPCPHYPDSLLASSLCPTRLSHHGWAELRLHLDPLLPGLEVRIGRNGKQCVVMLMNLTEHALPNTLGKQALTWSACLFTFSKMHY